MTERYPINTAPKYKEIIFGETRYPPYSDKGYEETAIVMWDSDSYAGDPILITFEGFFDEDGEEVEPSNYEYWRHVTRRDLKERRDSDQAWRETHEKEFPKYVRKSLDNPRQTIFVELPTQEGYYLDSDNEPWSLKFGKWEFRGENYDQNVYNPEHYLPFTKVESIEQLF